MTTQQPEALAADHSGDATDMVGRWYMADKIDAARAAQEPVHSDGTARKQGANHD